MAPDRRDFWALAAAACVLSWPAVWNGYPIVFADTGTYLSQAIHRYAGWDRPVFYSLFILPCHATITLWGIVAAQAIITTAVLRVACRSVLPRLRAWVFLIAIAGLSVFTWLPWLVSEVMPDLFTPLVVLAMALLAGAKLRRSGRFILILTTAGMIATQQSSIALSLVLAGVGLLLALARPAEARGGTAKLLVFAPPALAVIALCLANLAAFHRFSPSPYGNIFLLARVIEDGPGRSVLHDHCPDGRWRLCPYRDRLPPTSDDFIWLPDSPLNLAGGPKLVSEDADAIIRAAVFEHTGEQAKAALANTLEQLTSFGSGDGLNAWPDQISGWINRDFPAAEVIRYETARQQQRELAVPWPLGPLHKAAGLIGLATCIAFLPAALRRRDTASFILVAVLVAIPANAAITGALSGPHDRYQARIMWLPPFAAAVFGATGFRRKA